MAHPDKQRPDFSRLIASYPEQAGVIRHLLLRDQPFRQLCEEFLLFLDVMAAVEMRAEQPSATEREDYARLRTELELDIARSLLRSADNPRS